MPEEFVGAWDRVEFSLDGEVVLDAAQTIWLQGHSAYCDLRVPQAGSDDSVESFAGHTTFKDDRLYFSHDLDLNSGPAALADVGDVVWADVDEMVETGVFVVDGETVQYREVWRRLPLSRQPVIEGCDRGFAHVQVGSHSMTIEDGRPTGAFTACYRRDGIALLATGMPIATNDVALHSGDRS